VDRQPAVGSGRKIFLLRAVQWLAAAWAVAALASAPAAAEKRVALIIGVSQYQQVRQLVNPANDARLMAETLQKVGFTLIGGGPQLDLDRDRLFKAAESFGREVRTADVALFYYAGHAIQVAGSNYLVPVEANLESEADVHTQLLNVEAVLDQMEKARLKVVILDACRDNPFATGTRGGGTRGLAQMRASAQGTVIAFATAPGAVAQDGKGNNSPYAEALSQTLSRPGFEIFRTFNAVGLAVKNATTGRQIPWFTSSPLDGEFYFVPEQQAAAPNAAPPDRAASDPEPLELAPSAARTNASPSQMAAAGELASAAGPSGSSQSAPPPSSRVASLPAHPTGEPPAGKAQFRECESCPTMVIVPPGRMMLGSPDSEPGRSPNEGPQQEVLIARPFAVSRSEISFEEWLTCVAEGGCRAFRPGNYGWGEGKQPVINVSWADAKAYVEWLSQKAGATYRLPSEAEWEYAARGCTWVHCPSTPFWFGEVIAPSLANYDSRFAYNGSLKAQPLRRTAPVDAAQPNPFGLLHMHGNVREWTEDCWNQSLAGLPQDGSARTSGDCKSHVVRGGSWSDEPKDLRSAKRAWEIATERRAQLGFRVARSCRNADAMATGTCN